MAYDWSGLLGEIEVYSACRAPFLAGEDEEMRRRCSRWTAMPAEAQQQRFVPTGIGRTTGGRTVSSSQPTIKSILQAPRSSQQAVIALIGTLGAGDNGEDDEEPRRSASRGGGRLPGQAAARAGRPMLMRCEAKNRSNAETASRAAIAAGAQPVVIKVTSTVSSRGSAAGLMTYLGTREIENENGEKGKVDIPMYDQDGLAITNRNERAAALAEWGADFRDPYAVNALTTFSVTLSDEIDDAALHDALNAAFGSKPFLYSKHPDGKVSIFAVTDLPAQKIAGALRDREKGEKPARAAGKVEADFVRRLAGSGVSATARILGAAASEKSGRYFLEKFLRTEKTVTSGGGDPIKRGSSVRETAAGIWRAWSLHIRTVEPRNAFHVIFSARAGTDPNAMTRAVRDFLSEQVAGHRWISAHHPDTGHVHVHAMISARDDVGKALRLTKPELYQWRERFAAKAREHGIAMVATRRADVAATRPYSQAQAGAYERGKGDPRYLKSPDVAKRVERKRDGVFDRASLTNSSLALASKWHEAAGALKRVGAGAAVIAVAERFAAVAKGPAAQRMLKRLKGSVLSWPNDEFEKGARTGVPPNARLAKLTTLIGAVQQQKEKSMPLSLEQFNERVSRANKSMDGLEAMLDSSAERRAFEEMRREISALFEEQRRDIQMQQMRSVTDATGAGAVPAARVDEARPRDQPVPSTVDPAIVAQQQAIAAGRASSEAREPAGASKAAQNEQREQMLRQSQQERQRCNDRDAAER